jgi:hypothetical protein
MTVQELITGSFRLAGVLTHGQQAAPEEYETARECLNNILDNWKTQHTLVYVIDRKSFPLTSGVGEYSMGPGGVFNTERPVKIQSAGLIYYYTDVDGLEQLRRPLALIGSAEYAAIPEKTMASFEPLKLWNQNRYPLTYLSLWPIPLCP